MHCLAHAKRLGVIIAQKMLRVTLRRIGIAG